jgi:hypothetical protein
MATEGAGGTSGSARERLSRMTDEAIDDLLRDAAETKDLQQTFDRVWKAQMRGVERWQSAAPGRELTWPDQGDLVVWLLDQLKERERDVARYRQALEKIIADCDPGDPEWANPSEGRFYCYEIARKALDAEIAREKGP